ncbi:MAG: hypothetical protein U1A78_34545 [Polyangia bacterium]
MLPAGSLEIYHCHLDGHLPVPMVEDGQHQRWVLIEPFCRFWGIDLQRFSEHLHELELLTQPVLVEMVPSVTVCLPALPVLRFVEAAADEDVRGLVRTGKRRAFRELLDELSLLPALERSRQPTAPADEPLH